MLVVATAATSTQMGQHSLLIGWLLRRRWTLTELCHEGHVLAVHLGAVCWTGDRLSAAHGFAQCVTRSFLFTVLGEMASTTAHRAEDLVCYDGLSLLNRLQFSQCIILSKSSIKLSEFTQLLSPQVILTFRHLDTLFDYVMDLLHCFLYIFWVACSHIGMQGFILSRQWLTVLATYFSFLH